MRFLEKDISIQKFPQRKQITQEFKRGVVNGDMSAFKIEIARPYYFLPPNECCYNFVFGEIENPKKFWDNFYLIAKYCEPKNGSIAVYFEKNLLDIQNIKHVGIVEENVFKILSRWGRGNLYSHDYWQVPLSYGNRITFIENVFGK